MELDVQMNILGVIISFSVDDSSEYHPNRLRIIYFTNWKINPRAYEFHNSNGRGYIYIY